MAPLGAYALALLAAVGAVLYRPVSHRLVVFGFYRPVDKIQNVHGHEVKVIPNTVQCEDVHHHLDSGLLFAACQGKGHSDRFSWFPPLAIFTKPEKAKNGGLFVIDPKTFTSTELKLEGFSGPLVSHGIDIFDDPGNPSLLHIFAVNHPPNPKHFVPGSSGGKERDHGEPKAASRIEIFTHELGSKTATWRRSVVDPLVTTPNDIFATGPRSFYVTNDHHYREGAMRSAEDVLTPYSAPWTDIAYVRVHDIDQKADPTKGQETGIALRGLHNNNGLGRGAANRPREVVIGDASGGYIYRAERDNVAAAAGKAGEEEEDAAMTGAPDLKVVDWVELDSAIDNPSWFEDPYANGTHDASGYVLAGLARAMDLPNISEHVPVPTVVWHVRANNKGNVETSGSHNEWEKRMVWLDNGSTIQSASAGVVVAIDPKENDGRKQGWLFITGFVSEAMVASRIDL